MNKSGQPRKSKVASELSVRSGSLYIGEIEECSITDNKFFQLLEDKYTKAIRIQSLASNWNEEYWNGGGWSQSTINLEMTLRSEVRNGNKVWYAYRRRGGVLSKRYVGFSLDVTTKKLVDIARSMP